MYQIPAIEWDELILNGDTTLGNPTITSITSTTGIASGMVIASSVFAYNTRVVSFNANSVTLSTNALSNETGEDFSFYKRIDFEYPAERDQGEQAQVNQAVSFSLSGIQQTVTNHIELKRKLSFNFVTKNLRDSLRDDFYFPWCVYGKPFRYFNDKDTNSLVVYTNDSRRYFQERTVKKNPDYLYKIDFDFRRVLP